MSAVDDALNYVRRGWNPVPVAYRTKEPVGGIGWQNITINEMNVGQYFNGGLQNIGVQLGKRSNGLTDVDLDCSEAISIAPYVLPPTKAVFGRKSARASHRLYKTDLAEVTDNAFLQFRAPGGGMIVELRIGGGDKGAQSVAPGSVHEETGEEIVWEPHCDGEPATVDGADLRQRVERVAALSLIARRWPDKGGRHEAALALGGFLARSGLDEIDIGLAAEAVARAAGDLEWKDRVQAAKDNAKHHMKTERGKGLPALVALIGEVEGRKAAEWLGYRGGESADEAFGDWAEEVIPIELDVIDAGEDDWNVSPREWLLGNVFCRGFLSSLIADGGVGKTAMRYAQYLSLAIGRSLTGEHVFQRCRVLVLSMEDSTDELRRRMKAACMHYGVAQEELKGWLFYKALRAKDGKLMGMDPRGRPIRGALAAGIERVVTAKRIDLVALDPFVKTHSVEENSNSGIDDVVQILSDLAIEHDVSVDTPHHTSKGAADPGNANRGRGASAMKDAARLVYTLAPMSLEEAVALGVSENERRALVRMDSGKVNIAPPMREAKWFKLVGVALGNATERYPAGDTVQTVEPWAPTEVFDSLSDEALNLILDDIEAGAGLPTGSRYSAYKTAKKRAAWQVVRKHLPDKTEGQARAIVKSWVDAGLVIEKPYRDAAERKDLTGLWVDTLKRFGIE